MNFFGMQGIFDHRSKKLHKRHVCGGSFPYVAPMTLYASVFTSTIHILLENETLMSICCDFVQHGVVVGNTAKIKQRLSFLTGNIVTHVPLVEAVNSYVS